MKYYNSISEGYNKLHKEEQLKKLAIIKKNIKIKNSDYLLDVGCGTAFSLEHFNCKKTGVDPSIRLLKQNKKDDLIQSVGEYLPFKDDSFDIIISITAIHNFDDLKKGLREIKRVAKDKIIISTLKRSSKNNLIEKEIMKLFKIDKIIKEDKDIIYFLNKK
jgi:ubiquinone/menaquinone biosynthesis C-methylase UbiE